MQFNSFFHSSGTPSRFRGCPRMGCVIRSQWLPPLSFLRSPVQPGKGSSSHKRRSGWKNDHLQQQNILFPFSLTAGKKAELTSQLKSRGAHVEEQPPPPSSHTKLSEGLQEAARDCAQPACGQDVQTDVPSSWSSAKTSLQGTRPTRKHLAVSTCVFP